MTTILQEGVLSAPWLLSAGKAAFAFAGVLGLIAVVSPRSFARLAEVGGTWVDTTAFFKRIDRPFYVDVPVLHYSRLFGLCVAAGAAVLVWITPAEAAWVGAAWIVATGLFFVGIIAAICPAWFRRIATLANTWIDTSWITTALDYRIDIDHAIIRHSRVFGVCVLASIAIVAALVYLG